MLVVRLRIITDHINICCSTQLLDQVVKSLDDNPRSARLLLLPVNRTPDSCGRGESTAGSGGVRLTVVWVGE